jgi:outer membrane protein assembly factor BamB
MLTLFWTTVFVSREIEMLTFVRFLSTMATSGILILAFTIWWFRRKGVSRVDRLFGFCVTLATGILAAVLCDKSFGPFGLLMFSLPCVFTTGTLWLLLARRIAFPRPQTGLAIVVALTWGYFTLIRSDGISGEQRSAIRWRWTPTAEELYLAQKLPTSTVAVAAASTGAESASAIDIAPLVLSSGDWPSFRGPERDGVARGIEISTDWSAARPQLVWKQRVGPAWSSVIIVSDRLFTQEQRGEFEAVVCLDAKTGREIWAHQDYARFWESVAGAGPRATPTFDSGRIYTQGATGILNCLDATTGRLLWTRNIASESGAKLPMWGFSSSPLAAAGLVIAFAGGQNGQGLLAYRADSGEPVWAVATGQGSYSSPMLTSIGGQPQVLFLSDGGLIAVEAGSGQELWSWGSPAPGAPVSLQPHPLNDSQVLLASASDFGLALVEVSHKTGAWVTEKRWPSSALHPSFNDFVVCQRAAFGFDEAVFGCFDAETGKRRWKKGRYGHGQVLLLQDQGLLLVLAETGEVVLLRANPDKHEELCRFQAIEGKTWNHPAVAHSRLYVRNAEEMACYELARP